jgi:hypothetical protein
MSIPLVIALPIGALDWLSDVFKEIKHTISIQKGPRVKIHTMYVKSAGVSTVHYWLKMVDEFGWWAEDGIAPNILFGDTFTSIRKLKRAVWKHKLKLIKPK